MMSIGSGRFPPRNRARHEQNHATPAVAISSCPAALYHDKQLIVVRQLWLRTRIEHSRVSAQSPSTTAGYL